MKHIVMRYMSSNRKGMPYGIPGIGDLVHTALITYNYGKFHNQPATMHIGPHQYNRDKPQIWKEIINLFPKNSVHIQVHDFHIENDKLFFDHVLQTYPDALLHYYEKYPGKCQQVLQPSFFVDEYLKTFPCLPANPVDIKLPNKFVTAQFDTTSNKRKLTPQQLQQVKEVWNNKGYELLLVGGQATTPLLKTLSGAGYAMSKAYAHVGVDSGYLHLAHMYFPANKIYVYCKIPEDRWSHHQRLMRDNGIKINEY